jgi:hypothetical protein
MMMAYVIICILIGAYSLSRKDPELIRKLVALLREMALNFWIWAKKKAITFYQKRRSK